MAALAESAALLYAIADALPNPISYCDRDFVCRFANAACMAWLRLAPGTAEGRHIRDLIGRAAFELAEPYALRALRGDAQRLEQERRRPDGALGRLVTQYIPHRVGGEVVGVVVISTDVTEAERARHQVEAAKSDLERRVHEGTAALRASDERFTKAFHAGPVALVVCRVADGRVVEVNDQFVTLSGFSREEVLGRVGEEILPAACERFSGVLDRANAHLHNVEQPFTTKSGEARFALVSREPIDFGAEGPCVLTTLIDITDRKQAERRLALQNALSLVLAEARSLREGAPRILRTVCEAEGWNVGTIWEVDRASNALRCVHVWRRPGVDVDELVALTTSLTFERGVGAPGRVWLTGEPELLFDVRDAPEFVRRSAALRSGQTCAFMFPLRHGDHVVGVMEFIGGARPNDPQELELLTAIGRQIGVFAERTRTEVFVRRSEERFKAVIESLNEGFILTNRDGKILHWNAVARALHGLADNDDPSFAVSKFVSTFRLSSLEGEHLRVVDWPISRILRGESIRDMLVRVKKLDSDGERIFSYGGSLVRQPDGSEVAVLTVNDVTERMRRDELRRLSEQLEEDNRRMREASEQKSAFLANMSHELRTPLNAIIGFTSLLHKGRAGPVTEEQKEYLGDVLSSSHHLLQLISDILDLAKVEGGHVEVTVADIDTAKLVNEVRDVLRGLPAAQSLQLSVAIDPSLSRVRADERMLKQILYNYLSNAIKFTPKAGSVWIRVLDHDERSFRVEVEDTGIGISESDVEKLFVEFQQLDSGVGKKYQGTGLGLALTKKLAEAQGGHVGVTSKPGEGSRFFVVLPRDPPSPSA